MRHCDVGRTVSEVFRRILCVLLRRNKLSAKVELDETSDLVALATPPGNIPTQCLDTARLASTR